MKIITYLFVFSFLVFASCETNEDTKNKLVGYWQGTSWTANGKSISDNPSRAQFEFNADKTFRSIIGSTVEEGTFYLTGYRLFTTAKDREKIMVLIKKITKDELIFEMNRGGQKEELVLKKMK